MCKLIVVVLILAINLSCSCLLTDLIRSFLQRITPQGVAQQVKPIASTSSTGTKILTSDLPRSQKSAERVKFSWSDFGLEKDLLEERYPPLVDVSYGGPNYMPAKTVVKALIEVASNHSEKAYEIHQYTRAMGIPRLVNIVAKFYSPLMKRNLNPMKEILITAGSFNSLDLAARAFINPGDEIILFEPFYFDYRSYIYLSGGVIVTLPLRPRPGTTGESSRDWTFDSRELESKITKKTKIIWLNNPNNPLGKVYTMAELTAISNLARKYDLLVLSDEAAQWYVYEDPPHIRIATLPGMFERTLTLTSGGKTFSNTGWRVAWVIAPERLLWPMASIIVPAIANVATPMQTAFAIGMEEEFKLLGTPQSHFTLVINRATKTRDLLVSILKSVGAEVVIPTSGYCVAANFTKLINQVDLSSISDTRPGMKLYKYLLINKGVAAYPMSLLYSDQNVWQAEYSIRFTNFKTEQTLRNLGQLMPNIFERIK